MTRAEQLVAAAFRGFGEALVAADGGPSKKQREPAPHVIAVDMVRKAVQESLPGILQQMADEAPPDPLDLDRTFGIEDETERQRAQEPGETYDPNLPGSGGWRTTDA